MKSKLELNIIIKSAIFACLITIGAYLALPMPLVPFTMQVMFVMMAGQIGGRKVGFYSVLIYILLGVMGVPVFSKGGGLSYILSPTFGYILGFLISAYVIGILVEKKDVNIKIIDRFFSNIIGMIFIYFCGYFYYLLLTKIHLKVDFDYYKVFKSFVLIFIPKEILSCVFAAVLSDKISKILKKRAF